jgi:hypothetical protein
LRWLADQSGSTIIDVQATIAEAAVAVATTDFERVLPQCTRTVDLARRVGALSYAHHAVMIRTTYLFAIGRLTASDVAEGGCPASC